MRFTCEPWDERYSAPFSKLTGTYELELHPTIEAIVRLAPTRIVEVGAAEGYYAIGLARRIPRANVIAFDELPRARAILRELAVRNGVADRVAIRERCECDDLSAALGDGAGTLLMLDVEGYELTLLDPIAVTVLRRVPILVECHDFIVAGVTSALIARFAESHHVRTIANRARTLRDLPMIPWLVRRYCRHQVLGWANERVGGPMVWLWLEPKSRDEVAE